MTHVGNELGSGWNVLNANLVDKETYEDVRYLDISKSALKIFSEQKVFVCFP